MGSNRPVKIVASGFPSPADDFAEHALDLNKFVIKHPASTFYMRNKGHANKKYGIEEGDILVVDRSLKPSLKYLNLITMADEFKVRDYNELQKLLKTQNQDAEFWGVITAIVRKF
jgi:DNA polymerase V